MKPQLLLIDNYDSFTYNLVQAFLVLGADVRVVRNDQITTDEAVRLNPTHLCISPGPGTPRDAGVSMKMICASLHPRLTARRRNAYCRCVLSVFSSTWRNVDWRM